MIKIVGHIVILPKGNVAGVVRMDTVAEKHGPVETDVMDHLVGITFMLVFSNRPVS